MPIDWNQLIPMRRSLLRWLKHLDDQKSWQDFYDIYSRLIYGAAIKTGLTEAEAEDVVQNTVIAVAKAIQGFKYEPEKCAFKTWLHAINRGQVTNQYRKRQGKDRLFEPLPTLKGDEDATKDIPEPASLALDETWELNLLRASTERVKQRVSPAQFQIF